MKNEDGDAKSTEEFGISSSDYPMNVEDQVETSKLVLQLVTESRFNMTQINGQRKLGGPPPGWKGPAPGPGCEVFVGKIPRTLYEHEIYPIFRKMGEVYEIRLMMDFSGTNRGYCFVMFGLPEEAMRAIRELDNFEIRPGRRIGVVASINNCRLYVGQLPTHVTSDTVIRKIYDITDDVGQVSVYRNANDQARYALISYRTHRGAAMARRRLVPERASLFGGAEVSIDWAHPSMFPSNVVEDTGTCDDQGNIEISRLVVGSENKRYQNRRRARDDFLDHSIRAYLQADRAVEQKSRAKQNSQNQSLSSHSLDSVGRDLINFHIFDQNPGNSNPKNYCQRVYSRPDKRTLRESNSSFDMNGGSGSSESSGCSSQSSASDRNQTFSDPSLNCNYQQSRIYYQVENEEDQFSGNNRNSSDSSDQKFAGKTDPDSLNLFDNYTFSANSQEQSDFEDQIQDGFQNRSTACNDESFVERGGENERKLRFRNRSKNGVRNFPNQQQTNFQELKTFSKTVGEPPKFRGNYLVSEIVKNRKDLSFDPPLNHRQSSIAQSASPFANFSRSQNRNSLRNKNSRNSDSENFPIFQRNSDFFNPANPCAAHPPNFHHGINSNAKRSWLSHLTINACDYSGNGSPANSNNNLIVYSDSGAQINFDPGQSFDSFAQNNLFQNKKNYEIGKNAPKGGRPILSRSWASRCDDN